MKLQREPANMILQKAKAFLVPIASLLSKGSYTNMLHIQTFLLHSTTTSQSVQHSWLGLSPNTQR